MHLIHTFFFDMRRQVRAHKANYNVERRVVIIIICICIFILFKEPLSKKLKSGSFHVRVDDFSPF